MGGAPATVCETARTMTHSTSTPPEPRPRRRWPFVLLLLGSLLWIGLTAGTAVGAKWFVPADSGLAGPAIALGYGVLGAVAGLVLGAVLAWKAPHGLLRAASAVAGALAAVLAGLVIWRVVTLEAQRRAQAGMDVPLPPPAGFRIESRIAESDEMRRYRQMTIDADAWTATWIAVGPEAATCTAELIFDEAAVLLRPLGLRRPRLGGRLKGAPAGRPTLRAVR